MADAAIVSIGDPADPRLEAYRDIRERDLVKRHRQFIAEGKTVLQVLLRQRRFSIESLLLLENRIRGMADLLKHVPPDVPIYVASQEVINAIAGFHMHRGVLALGAAPEESAALPAAFPRSWKTVVVLAGISNHDNMGAIFRNAAAFGADAVILDPECCDPLYRKAIRVSVGGVFLVPFFRCADIGQAVAVLRDQGFAIAALSPTGSKEMADWEPGARQAIMLGSEGEGLPREWLKRLETVSVAMAGGFDSLNVATAGAIALHRVRTAAGSR